MNSTGSIADAVLSLSASERADIAMRLMDSLPPDAWDGAEILAEAERRDAEIESGRVKELSHDEFLAGLER